MTKFFFAFAAALLFPVLAFAQAVVDPLPAPGPVSQFFVSLLPHLLQIVSGLLLAVVFPSIYAWIAAKKAAAVAGSKSAALLNFGDKVAHLSELAVANVDAKMLPEVAKRAEDGVLDAADKAALRSMGLDELKALLGPDALKEAAAALGTSKAPAPPAVVDQYLVSHNEVAVDAKNALAA